jgi:hypothetical protein
VNEHECTPDCDHEGREEYEMDIDRMVSEGLGAGLSSGDEENGDIPDSTTDHMDKQ